MGPRTSVRLPAAAEEEVAPVGAEVPPPPDGVRADGADGDADVGDGDGAVGADDVGGAVGAAVVGCAVGVCEVGDAVVGAGVVGAAVVGACEVGTCEVGEELGAVGELVDTNSQSSMAAYGTCAVASLSVQPDVWKGTLKVP